jgi:hypothetical protein
MALSGVSAIEFAQIVTSGWGGGALPHALEESDDAWRRLEERSGG